MIWRPTSASREPPPLSDGRKRSPPDCDAAPRLIVGTGAGGQLPIMPELYREARRRGVEVIARPTAEACALLEAADPREVAAVLHVTC